MNNRHRRTRHSSSRAGFTLVEVAVALAIFIFGAIAIIRIFPPALGVITNSGDRTSAVNMNRSTTGRFEGQPGQIPFATYDVSPASNASDWNENRPGSVVGTPSRNNTLPTKILADFNGTSLNHFKGIQGEFQTVQSDLVTAKPFILTNYSVQGTPSLYREDEILGVTIDQYGYLNFRDATRKSNNATFAGAETSVGSGVNYPLLTGANTTYYVSYRWLEPTDTAVGRSQGVIDEPLQFATATLTRVYQGYRLPTVSGYDATRHFIVPGAVGVRIRELIGSAPAPTTDNNLRGLIYVDGLGLSVGDKVSVDYQVNDWRYLVTDSPPAIATSTTERAVILPIKGIDDTLVSPQPWFTTLLLSNSAANVYSLYPAKYDSVGPSGSRLGTITPDTLKTATVPFDVSGLPAPRARVVYRTLDNWVHQISVAPGSYYPAYSYTGATQTISQPYRRYFWSPNSSEIYFPPSEAGKTVLISYSYLEGTTLTNVVGAIAVIRDEVIEAPASALIPSSVALNGYVSVAQPQTDLAGNAMRLVGIDSIQGLSVQARTAWLNGDKWTQSSITSYRGAS